MGAFNWSLYLWNAATRQFQLYRDEGTEIKSTDVKRLAESGISTVYLDASEYGRFQEQLRASLSSTIADESVPASQRLGVLNEVVRDVLRETFRYESADQAVKQTSHLANHVVDLVCREDLIASELHSVLHFDYMTFTHSANVGYYTVMLAQALGYTERAVLQDIGTGALLHDIGKRGIPEQILLKPGALTAEERRVIQSHPTLGLVSLKNQDELNFGQLMMVYQHHERLNGSGYPVRHIGRDIHEWAKICAVADVFEALTSNRPYRRPLSIAAALEVMEQTEAQGLEPEFLRCWKMTINTK
jgi:HD-GYP domain-containing protein (c-di-GMP phosphodiesterase class II)